MLGKVKLVLLIYDQRARAWGRSTMQYGVGVEYALHSLFYMIDLPGQKSIGIREIAALHGIKEPYLSKVFAKLARAGLVRSVAGVNGGYELARSAEDISFWDVIEAIEGNAMLFRCAEIRKRNIFVDDPKVFTGTCPCLIKVVIHEAEELMRNQLRSKSLHWLHEQAAKDFSKEKKAAIAQWVKGL
jgi:Rrf2 family protein